MKKLIRHNSQVQINALPVKRLNSGVVNGRTISADYYVIENVAHMVRDSVMNDILYAADVFDPLADSLMKSNARIPAPMSHPHDEQGNFLDANDPITWPAHNVGAFDTDWRVVNDKLVSNTYIPKVSVDAPQEQFEAVANLIKAKQPIDRSTGLYLDVIDEEGIGKDGEPYSQKVSTIYELNHSAILDPSIEPGAKNNSEGVGMFTNKKGEQSEITDVDLVLNNSSAAMRLPLAPSDTKWDSSAADKRIREYTNSTDEPSSNYRKFFMYFDGEKTSEFGAYKLPFADVIDGKPMAVKAAIDNAKARLEQTDISDTDKAKAMKVIEHYQARFDEDKPNMAKRAMNWLKSFFVNELSHEMLWDKLRERLPEDSWPVNVYNDRFVYRTKDGALFEQKYNVSENVVSFAGEPIEGELIFKPKAENREVDKKDIIALLNAKGISVNADATDEQLKEALNGAIASTAEGGNVAIEEQIQKAVANAIKPLQDQLNANADADKAALTAQVVELGIDEMVAKTMSTNQLKSVLALNDQSGFNAGGQFRTNGKNPISDMEAPE